MKQEKSRGETETKIDERRKKNIQRQVKEKEVEM